MEKKFDKYKARGNSNWNAMFSRDPRKFNAYQQARYGWILRTAGDVSGKKILDIGSGGGSLVYLLAKAGAEVVGIDNEDLGVEYAESNLKSVGGDLKYKFLKASAYELPFVDNNFDLVVSCEVLEHLSEPEKMLSEARRVLMDGGKLILTTPYRITEKPQDPNHLKEYYPGEVRDLIEKYFKNVEVKPTHHMFWRSLYVYGFGLFGGRAMGKWFVNLLSLLTGWNPFLKDYKKPSKFDAFTSILARGNK